MVVLAIPCFAGIAFFLWRGNDLKSSPNIPRPWAEEEFRRLTLPVQSPGKPTDPLYTGKWRVEGRSPVPNPVVDVEITSAAQEYVPKCDVIDFDATEELSGSGGKGKVLWLGAKTYQPEKPDRHRDFEWDFFHPDGTPMTPQEVKTARGNAGLSVRNEPYLAGLIAVEGYANANWKFQQLFDSATHVALNSPTSLWPQPQGVFFRTSAPIIHNAPLVAVFDIHYGTFRDLPCKAAAGTTITQPEFRLDVVEVVDGPLDTSAYNRSAIPNVKQLRYDTSHSPYPTTTSVLFQISPRSMRDAITLQALDTEGKEIEGTPKTDWGMSLYQFNTPLSGIASLRVRYRPDFTRLLLRIRSLPATPKANANPINLFDLTIPAITFHSPSEMQQFIARTVEFKDLSESTGSYSGFPTTLENASVRQVMDRYLALNPALRAIVRSSEQTIQFEDRRKHWPERTLKWLKAHTWWP